MLVGKQSSPYKCARYLYRQAVLSGWSQSRRLSESSCLPQRAQPSVQDENDTGRAEEVAELSQEVGSMTERLAEMTEESIEQGGRGAERMVAEAGFSEELKKQLEARLQESNFKSENAAAFAEVDMPSSAGRGTREQAAAQPWTGTESINDAALRMLNDAHKPLRGTGPPKIPQPRGPSISVDMRMKKAVQKSKGERLASARDRMSVYALSQDPTLSEKEREDMRKILKERFTSAGRPMPGSVQGLAALANERIEDAIGRGQFKNIAKGKGVNVERDHNADSPFLDTTEYFMNKMIKKQEIVPPWIEKQQELVRSAAHFRGRLRNDWKRHAARVISSSGGSLRDQMRRAEAYAVAEAALNPKTEKREALSEIDEEGKLSQTTITEMPNTATSEAQPDTTITVLEGLAADAPFLSQTSPEIASQMLDTAKAALSHNTQGLRKPQDPQQPRESQRTSSNPPPLQLSPFRDDAWLALESSYHTLAIRDLNNLTRSYNLQAPDLAKKPYFSLDRELRSCFADIAPQLPAAIRERARRPDKMRVEAVGHRRGGVLERFSTDRNVKVYDSQRPTYGFKNFWRDLWRSTSRTG